jgi:hypothetical protein
MAVQRERGGEDHAKDRRGKRGPCKGLTMEERTMQRTDKRGEDCTQG